MHVRSPFLLIRMFVYLCVGDCGVCVWGVCVVVVVVVMVEGVCAGDGRKKMIGVGGGMHRNGKGKKESKRALAR